MEYRLKDIYSIYKKAGGKLDKKAFKLIVQTFLRCGVDAMLEGKPLELGYHIGRFQILRFERSFKNPQVNWGESNKYKQKLLDEGKQLYNPETKEGYQWLVYFTDGYYYGLKWKKEKIKSIDYTVILHNAAFYQLKTFARTSRKIAASIDELSPVIFESDGI